MEVKNLSEIPSLSVDLIILDLDNTLYDYHPNHKTALTNLIHEFCALFTITPDDAHALYMKCRKSVHNRHHGTAVAHSRLFYIQEMVESLKASTDVALTAKLYHLYWDTFIAGMELFPEAKAFLDENHEKNIPVVLVTDMTTEIQFKKLHQLDIVKYFTYIVSSEEAGVEKPHPYIFELAISKALRKNPAIKNVVVIGDDLKKDTYISDIYHIVTYNTIRNG